jgi:hypothetical protein
LINEGSGAALSVDIRASLLPAQNNFKSFIWLNKQLLKNEILS